MDIVGVSGKPDERQRFDELSVVSFRRSVAVGGRAIPAGTRATVVAAYSDGVGYEVEVFTPFHAVVTVEANDLTA